MATANVSHAYVAAPLYTGGLYSSSEVANILLHPPAEASQLLKECANSLVVYSYDVRSTAL